MRTITGLFVCLVVRKRKRRLKSMHLRKWNGCTATQRAATALNEDTSSEPALGGHRPASRQVSQAQRNTILPHHEKMWNHRGLTMRRINCSPQRLSSWWLKFMEAMKIHGKPLQFEMESDTAGFIISTTAYRWTWPTKLPSQRKAWCSYKHGVVKLVLTGTTQVQVRFKFKAYVLPL